MIQQFVQNILRESGTRLDTDLGQHFLIDEHVLSSIVDAAHLESGSRVLEIGPGIGVLTRELLIQGADVTAVELDRRLPPLLRTYVGRDRDTSHDRLRIIEGNALHVDLALTQPYAIVANIPYHITSPLLHRILLELPLPTSLTLLVQREVGEAIAAERTEHILTVLVQLCGTARVVQTVPPEAFVPPPAVDSAILSITCNTERRTDPARIRTILRVVKHAMSQRRKMLRGSMKSLPGGLEALHSASIDPERRPQSLTVEEWVRLTDALRPHA